MSEEGRQTEWEKCMEREGMAERWGEGERESVFACVRD